MLQVMRSWDLTMRGELDYREEADNLREVKCLFAAHMCDSCSAATTSQCRSLY
jgi:predicted unusual protein kinase regulating ubiquinone biosynthesis (AarF/ABC1/UbiB family)